MELYTDEPGFHFFTRRFNLGWEPQGREAGGREAVFGVSYGPEDNEWLDFTWVVPDPRGDHRGRWHLGLAFGRRRLLSAANTPHGKYWSWLPGRIRLPEEFQRRRAESPPG